MKSSLDAWAALVVRCAEAAVLSENYDEAFVFLVGALIAGEAGAEVAAVGDGGDGDLRRARGPFHRVIATPLLADRRLVAAFQIRTRQI